MKLWAGRFSKEADKKTNDFNSSIKTDSRMFNEDIDGSIAHASMLAAKGIISEEDCKHIFNRFYQSDSSRKDEGSGLGLALVKQITELCGGSIEVKSVLGKGSRFTVTLKKE